MSNTKLVPTWTFQRSLPEPFDVYSGSSAVFKNISSRYCTQPQKKATLHAATLQAVFTYMDLENPPAGKTPEELGAIGSQSNNFTIAEYPSRTGQLHVVIYNRITGKFIAGKFEQPLDLETQSEAYQFTETGNSGSALYFALMPTFLGDDEFSEKYQELKEQRERGYPHSGSVGFWMFLYISGAFLQKCDPLMSDRLYLPLLFHHRFRSTFRRQ